MWTLPPSEKNRHLGEVQLRHGRNKGPFAFQKASGLWGTQET